MRFIFNIFLVLSCTLSFAQKVANESMYVHTDKETYFPGEILWFKVYAAHNRDLRPVKTNSIAYLDLTDSRGVSVLQTKIETGQATRSGGSVFIPQRLGSGTYTLTASSLVSEKNGRSFSKKITILNPFAVIDSLALPSKGSYTVRLLPEGGTLVQGIETRIAYKISDAYGKGVKASLTLPDGKVSVANHLGIGSFKITPDLAGMKVKAKFPDATELEQAFPAVSETGYVLNVENKGDHYTIKVSTNAGRPGETLALVSELSGGTPVKHPVVLNSDGISTHVVSMAQLPEGTSKLTLFKTAGTSADVPLAERILFRTPEKALRLNLALDKKTFSAREEVSLSLNQLTDDLSLLADVSVSVKKIDDIQQPATENIRSYFYLRKDLSGEVENPDYYFSDSENRSSDLENLLLTHGWRKFTNYSGEGEERYHRVAVRFTDRTTGSPIPGQEAVLSVPSKTPVIYTAVTDAEGIAVFWIKNMFGTQNLATRLASGQLSHAEILKLRNETAPALPADVSRISQSTYNEYAINVQVENVFSGKNRATYLAPATLDSIPFFGKADVRYRLDDYTRFVVMEEIIREYVKEVNVRKNRDDFHLRTLDAARGAYFSNDPLILLDGIPVPRANEILAYDPLKVKNIDLITSRFYLGQGVYDGIISFTTYNGGLEGYTLDPSFHIFSYEGLQPEREFYSPVLSADGASGRSPVPDNRTVLYWNPRVILSGDAKQAIRFSSSDLSGEYLIDIQGIDSSGKPGANTLIFSVK